MGKMYKVKITVLKKAVYQDLADEYLVKSVSEKFTSCPLFEEGDEFIVDGWLVKPDNFPCTEAWTNIWGYLLTIARGGTFAPYTKEEGKWIVCCADGIKPVSFLLERDEDMNVEF